MEGLLQKLFAGLVITALVIQSSEDNYFFYVAPNLSLYPNCRYSQSCITFKDLLRYYWHISDSNFILIFLKGNHTPTRQLNLDNYPYYDTFQSNFTMVGESAEAIIYGIEITIAFAGNLHIENLTLTKGRLKVLEPTQGRLSSVTFVDVAVHITMDSTELVRLHNCKFLSGESRLTLYTSQVAFAGKPFFDVHFAPFKPAHRYWFGVLLLARGMLLIIFSSSYATPNNTNLLLLLITILILLLYMAIVQPYKNKRILVFQSSFFAKILFLGMFVAYAQTYNNQPTLKITAAGISVGVAFVQFCGIIIHSTVVLCHCKKNNTHGNNAHVRLEEEPELEKDFSANYRDSIISDSL